MNSTWFGPRYSPYFLNLVPDTATVETILTSLVLTQCSVWPRFEPSQQLTDVLRITQQSRVKGDRLKH